MALHPATRVGAVQLTVRDVARSAAFYTDRLGLEIHHATKARIHLGAGGEDLLVLVENRSARPQRGVTGLYHFALLLPSRQHLAHALHHLRTTATALTGASDHGVSEALYLADPDGNGIEIYRDRPRSDWPLDGGRLAMTTLPLDLADVLAEAPGLEGASYRLDSTTTLGHVHLHVADLEAAERFYVGVLGFEVMQHYGDSALFVSIGGYHHRVGLNTWQGVGAPPPSPDATGLEHFRLVVPDDEELERVAARLSHSKAPMQPRDDGILTRDPSGNGLLLSLPLARAGSARRVPPAGREDRKPPGSIL